MSTEHIETVIIGAGQAGLATGYHLQRCGRPFVILDGNERVGDGWRQQWDSLRLFSPARFDGLPGMAFPAPPWSYPGKDDMADYLEAYAARFSLPVRLGTRVERVAALGDGYLVTAGGQCWEADNVVVATGTFGRTPLVPGFADQLDPGIRQLHSSEYRRADQLREGPVLVVGASHSGGDIAYEVGADPPHDAGRPRHRRAAVHARETAWHASCSRSWSSWAGTSSPGGPPSGARHGGDPPPRWAAAAGQAQRPRGAGRRARHRARGRRPGGAAGPGRRSGRRGRERRLVHRVPPGVRLDRRAGPGRPTAGRRSTAVWCPTPRASSSRGWPSSTRSRPC